MATTQDVQKIRDYAEQPLASITVSEADLKALFDSEGLNGSVASLWRRYASSLSSLVDISENGSSRKNSDAFKNAMVMAEYWQKKVDDETLEIARRPTTRAIVRP